MSDFSSLSEPLAKNLAEAGFKTPEDVIKAKDEELWKVPGVSKKDVVKIKNALKGDTAVALEEMQEFLEEVLAVSAEDYPDTSEILNLNGKIVTVGTFRKLAKSISKK